MLKKSTVKAKLIKDKVFTKYQLISRSFDSWKSNGFLFPPPRPNQEGPDLGSH